MREPGGAGYRRLSESPLWTAQRRFYEQAGIDAWRSATVPHHVTSNVALATAYARVVHAFVDDTAPGARVDIVELGAGCGRFAFLFLSALEALESRVRGAGGRRSAPRNQVRYVMTDVADSTIAFWRTHDALAPFVAAGRLDFARFDADRDGTPRFERGARPLASGRIVVIANYVFGGLRADAYAIRAGRMHEYLVSVKPNRQRRGSVADVELAWRVGAGASAPYPEDDFNAILRDYIGPGADDARVLFPIGMLRCLSRLAALTREHLLVLAADRGTADAAEAVTRAVDLDVARHGALSFPVNFHALHAWVIRRGGQSLRPRHRPRHLYITGLLLGARGSASPATRLAYEAAVADGGPDELYSLRRGLSTVAEQLAPEALVSLMRLCQHDPRVVAECVRPLWPHLTDADAALRHDIRDATLAAWPNYFHIGEPNDVPFHLALLLYEARAHAGAQALLEASLRLYGEDAGTYWNLGLCHVALGKPKEAHASFRRARRLAPGLNPVGLVPVKGRGVGSGR